MLSFPSSPSVGQRFQGWVWDGVKWAPTKIINMPRCGRFALAGSSPNSTVKFSPYNGDTIKINGLLYKIPSAGITATQGSLYLDKVPGSSLVIGGVYYVYAFWTGTALALNFSLTGRAHSTTPGNVGTPIRAGDDTQTLVGIVNVGGVTPNVFYDQDSYRYTRSWLHRPRTTMSVQSGGANGATSPVNVLSVIWIGFSDDTWVARGQGCGTATGVGNLMTQLVLNGGVVGSHVYCTTPYTTGQYVTCAAHGAGNSPEGVQAGLNFQFWLVNAGTFSPNWYMTVTLAGLN
jgi:hypothetical protein